MPDVQKKNFILDILMYPMSFIIQKSEVDFQRSVFCRNELMKEYNMKIATDKTKVNDGIFEQGSCSVLNSLYNDMLEQVSHFTLGTDVRACSRNNISP